MITYYYLYDGWIKKKLVTTIAIKGHGNIYEKKGKERKTRLQFLIEMVEYKHNYIWSL